ncbi:MAG: phosphonoacetaldehyde reductase [Clostridiales bacterium]|jgi:alcohol dehydrogenase class IV|nr:phosphonoacetaldehyde reductase [Clostridiales bacterium]
MKNEQIIIGAGSVSQISKVLDSYNVKKFMLVCGNSFDKQSFKRYFEQISIPFVRFSDFSPNPLYEYVCKGVDAFKKNNCDCLVAVGGGSAIDVAKCIKLFCKMDDSKNYLTQPYADTGIILITVPTTAGTGSESTRHAVIYLEGEKQSISHDSLVPEVAILDSLTLKKLPLYHKKSAMLDALCQAIESWWSVSSNKESKDYSKQATGIIMQNWEAYIEKGDAYASEQIMLAANLAGRAINITATTAAHAMSYKLSSIYGISHGHAVAVCLPNVWEHMTLNLKDCVDPRGEAYLQSIFEDIRKVMGCLSVEEGISLFREILSKLKIKAPVRRDKRDIDILANSVHLERLNNNPVKLNKKALCSLYSDIIE